MKLATIGELRAAISARDSEDTSLILETSLRQVTLNLESVLCTTFGYEAQCKDVFYVDPNEFAYCRDSIKFILNKMLLNLSVDVDPLVPPPLTLRWGNTLAESTAASPDTTSTPLINTTLGSITYLDRIVPYKYAEITYNAGMTTGPDGSVMDVDGVGPVYADVPQWLKQAALTYAYEVYQAFRMWSNDTSRAAYKPVSGSRLPSNPPTMIPAPSPGVLAMLRPYMRSSSMGVYPINNGV